MQIMVESRSMEGCNLSRHQMHVSPLFDRQLPVTFANKKYCTRTLPRGGMYWEIHPPRTNRFPEGRDFATQGLRDCLRVISRVEGCKFPTRGKSQGGWKWMKTSAEIHASLFFCVNNMYLWLQLAVDANKKKQSPFECWGAVQLLVMAHKH